MPRTLRWSVIISVALILCLTVIEGSVLAKKRKKRRKARTAIAKTVILMPPVLPSSPVVTPEASADPKSIFRVSEFGVGTSGTSRTDGKIKVGGGTAGIVAPASALISELRLRGPAGVEDEFVEIYNNSDTPLTVQASDASTGWAIVISDGTITGPICTIPNGTLIPGRGHLLCANTNGYSLAGYPSGNPPVVPPTAGPSRDLNFTAGPAFALSTPDRTFDFDVPDGSGVALFSTTNGVNFTAGTRLDAFGFAGSPALYKEGVGFSTITTANVEHTYYRDLKNATPKDTQDNASDFRLVGTSIGIQVAVLGSPGPENLASPIVNNSLGFTLIDSSQPQSSAPNRERSLTVETNANNGTLLIRRTVTNNTGQPVSRLRFRVVDITTLGTCVAPCADLRLLTSTDGVAIVNAVPVIVRGLRLEEPPESPAGGGLNASVSADFITLPAPLAAGQSINIVFKLGVMRTGAFRFFINIEMLNGSPAPPLP